MTREQKLDAIVRKIDELLEVASKRTPGRWVKTSKYATHLVCENSKNYGNQICDFPDSSPNCSQHEPDSDFIAACAGPAEAGWIATKESIHALRQIENTKWNWDGDAGVTGKAEDALSDIINAWEELI